MLFIPGVEQMDLNLKVEGLTPPWVMRLSFLLAFACTEKSVLVPEGKCSASLLKVVLCGVLLLR